MTLRPQDTLLSTICPETGLQRMRAYLAKQRRPKSAEQSHAGCGGLPSNKFAREEANGGTRIDLDGWTEGGSWNPLSRSATEAGCGDVIGGKCRACVLACPRAWQLPAKTVPNELRSSTVDALFRSETIGNLSDLRL